MSVTYEEVIEFRKKLLETRDTLENEFNSDKYDSQYAANEKAIEALNTYLDLKYWAY